jgi:hypothetical protein
MLAQSGSLAALIELRAAAAALVRLAEQMERVTEATVYPHQSLVLLL